MVFHPELHGMQTYKIALAIHDLIVDLSTHETDIYKKDVDFSTAAFPTIDLALRGYCLLVSQTGKCSRFSVQ